MEDLYSIIFILMSIGICFLLNYYYKIGHKIWMVILIGIFSPLIFTAIFELTYLKVFDSTSFVKYRNLTLVLFSFLAPLSIYLYIYLVYHKKYSRSSKEKYLNMKNMTKILMVWVLFIGLSFIALKFYFKNVEDEKIHAITEDVTLLYAYSNVINKNNSKDSVYSDIRNNKSLVIHIIITKNISAGSDLEEFRKEVETEYISKKYCPNFVELFNRNLNVIYSIDDKNGTPIVTITLDKYSCNDYY